MAMDFSPLGHAVAAVVLQCTVGIIFHEWIMGGALGGMWFIAREQTQAEYRWIAAYGAGKRVNMPWWGGFDYRVWNIASLLDCFIPVLACAIVILIAR